MGSQTLKTSNVKLGQLSPSKQYIRGRYEEINRFDSFVNSLSKTKPVTSNLIGDAYQANYLQYMEMCWSDHLGAVFTPDILWYSILCELTLIVKSDPEKFRSLFTTSNEKQTIEVMSDSPTILPMDAISEALSKLVPTDSKSFLPSFSTSNNNSIHAFQSAFADMASPYYNYCMFCCGIPFVDVRGSESDYKLVIERVNGLIKLFVNYFTQDGMIWLNKVKNLCIDIYDNLNSNVFWSEIFSLERCGSGSDVEVSGWWKDVFLKKPLVGFITNYSTHQSIIEYKYLPTNNEYKMIVGLMSSKMENEFLVPDFGYIVFDK